MSTMPATDRREARLFFADGLFDLALGIVLLLMGLLALIPESGWMLWWYLPWIFLTMALRAAKQRWAVPRGGVGQLPPQGGRARLALMVGLLVLLLVVGLTMLLGWNRDAPWARALGAALGWLVARAPLIIGVAVALALGKVAWKSGHAVFWAYAVLSLVAGVAVWLLLPALGDAVRAWMWLNGAVLALAGVARWRAFCRTHPKLAPGTGAS